MLHNKISRQAKFIFLNVLKLSVNLLKNKIVTFRTCTRLNFFEYVSAYITLPKGDLPGAHYIGVTGSASPMMTHTVERPFRAFILTSQLRREIVVIMRRGWAVFSSDRIVTITLCRETVSCDFHTSRAG